MSTSDVVKCGEHGSMSFLRALMRFRRCLKTSLKRVKLYQQSIQSPTQTGPETVILDDSAATFALQDGTNAGSQSGLLRLPSELRNYIYTEALIEDCDININLPKPLAVEPGLLHVCTLIRKEARPIFYADNAFLLLERSVRKGVLSRLSPEKLRLLRLVKILPSFLSGNITDEQTLLRMCQDFATSMASDLRLREIDPGAMVFPIYLGEPTRQPWDRIKLWVTSVEVYDFVLMDFDGRKCVVRQSETH